MSIKLVFADDSVTMQKVIQLTLDSEDIDLRIVNNGEEALSALKEERADIVVADVSIPGINGFELCKQIKSSPATGEVPVILVSGELEEYDENLGRSAGADAHITKPFKSGEFIDAVKKLAVKDFNPTEKAELAEESVPPSSATAEEKSFGQPPSPAEKPEIPVMLELDPEKSLEDGVAEEINDEMEEEFEIVDDDLDIEDDLDEDDVEIEEVDMEEQEKASSSDEKSETGVTASEQVSHTEEGLEEIPDEADKILEDVFKEEYNPSAVLDETPSPADEKPAPAISKQTGQTEETADVGKAVVAIEKPPETVSEHAASKGMDELFRDSIEHAVHSFLKNEAGGILKEVLSESVDRHMNTVFKTQLETVIREEISKAIGESFQSSMPELLGMIEKITSHITPRIAEEMIKIAIEQIKKGDK